MVDNAFMKVDISSILGQINENITFFQPLFEAIINSLDASATNIEVDIKTDKQKTLFDNIERVAITGYSVTDNGTGFTADNRTSFLKYLSSYKQKLGCKGIGRFTWLKIFDNISIESFTGEEKVSFTFNSNFSENDITAESNTTSKKTIVSFLDINSNYYKKFNNAKLIESDESLIVDLEKIKETISDYLSVKLFLLDNLNVQFSIKINLGSKSVIINNSNITKFDEKTFSLYASLDEGKTSVKYDFSLYYTFESDAKNKHKHFYCAHGRTVKPFTKSVNNKFLPNHDSSIMLLTSEYFNERTNNEWNEFVFNMHDNNKSPVNPLPIPTINERLKEIIDSILVEKYPTLSSENENIVNECIDECPHLAKYIRKDTSQIKVKSEVLKTAQKTFVDEKEKVKENFIKMLESKKHANKEVFLENISKINDISARELAQYFLYREQIIKAIQKVKEDDKSTEADLHNLFMKMGTISNEDDQECNIYDTNLWLFDDKFLTYNCAFSDKRLKQIKQYISESYSNTDNDNNEPDITVFYNNISEEFRDIVVIEFKGPNAKELQNGVGVYELSRNIYPVVETMDNVRMAFGYVILNIDEQMSKNLSRQPGVKTFSHGDCPIFYVYNENIKDKNQNNIPVHTYIVSINSICKDAELRNKTFLNIIKNK